MPRRAATRASSAGIDDARTRIDDTLAVACLEIGRDGLDDAVADANIDLSETRVIAAQAAHHRDGISDQQRFVFHVHEG
jgi:hypothetical protein